MAQNMQGTGRLELCLCPRRAWGYVGNDSGAQMALSMPHGSL